MRQRILVVEDDESLRKVIAFQLREAGYEVDSAAAGQEAQQMLRRRTYDLVLTDLKMPGLSGMELLGWVREHYPRSQVIVITAFGTVDDAVSAMKLGAFDFITKPVNREALRVAVAKALEHSSLHRRVRQLEREVSDRFSRAAFISASPAMAEVLDVVEKIAPTDATVLITGESGTGKELIAKMIHYNSGRRSGPLVAINCAAIPKDLLESEMFGYVRGAFTGAVRDKPGKFEEADGGTIFLDEIGEMSPELQVKLLRALESGEIDVLGRANPRPIDTRIVSASNRDLQRHVAEGGFREDLFYRINVIHMHLPPLRERVEDIPILARFFFDRLAGDSKIEVDPEVYRLLQQRTWPGNVRELRNACERMVLLRSGDKIAPHDIPADTAPLGGGRPVVELPNQGYPLEKIERDAIEQALARTGGNQTQAARLLDIPRHVLIYRMRKYGIE